MKYFGKNKKKNTWEPSQYVMDGSEDLVQRCTQRDEYLSFLLANYSIGACKSDGNVGDFLKVGVLPV